MRKSLEREMINILVIEMKNISIEEKKRKTV
jgi:hypothetical protein